MRWQGEVRHGYRTGQGRVALSANPASSTAHRAGRGATLECPTLIWLAKRRALVRRRLRPDPVTGDHPLTPDSTRSA